MAEVNAKDLTTKTSPASTDSMLLFGTTSNEGAKITVDNLADNILGRLTTKTFANQVGGSSAATILAQLATLNSNKATYPKVIHNAMVQNMATPEDTVAIQNNGLYLLIAGRGAYLGYSDTPSIFVLTIQTPYYKTALKIVSGVYNTTATIDDDRNVTVTYSTNISASRTVLIRLA